MAPEPMTAHIVQAIAEKLADPQHVAATAARPGNELVLPTRTISSWGPAGLSDAHPAVALLFAELGAADPAHHPHAHGHLTATLAGDTPPPVPALYTGIASVGFAAHAAAIASGRYTTILSQLDQKIAQQARQWARIRDERITARGAAGDWSGYDVISGGAGLGRHLMARLERTRDDAIEDALRAVLDVLVRLALAGDATAAGRRVSAWWVDHDAGADLEGAGHLNLGLAHGIGGPLALLALAWQAGVRVERHAEAVAAIVALLDEHLHEDESGPYWAHWITLDGTGAARRTRDVWCHGAAGMGRALYLAGAAFEEKGWQDTGAGAVRGALATAGEQVIADFALCHGWAGLLHIATRMALDTGEPFFAIAADGYAARIVRAYDPDAPFGYRYAHPAAPEEVDRPGFLEGAAGIALALHCHATGAPPATGWDGALLLG